MDVPRRKSGGRELIWGTVWNALGRGVPLFVALLLTPFLVAALGTERWGLFTLALAVVGIFGVFDLGLGMALTRAAAEAIGEGRAAEARAIVGAALLALLGVSSVIAAVTFAVIPLLIERVLIVPATLKEEAVNAFRLLVLAAPLVVLNAALWGVLAAWQRFRAGNLINIPINVFYYLGPLAVLLVDDSLVAVIAALLMVRLACAIAYALLVLRDVPGLGLKQARFGLLRPLLRQGGWMSLSGALVQLFLYADRFLIGAMVGLTAVAYYATPLDLVLRLWILPIAVAQALLPTIASSFRTTPAQAALQLRRASLIVAALMLPIALLLVIAAEWLLWLWLGAEFATGSGGVLRILGVGAFFSCLAFIPATLIDAVGRPEVGARFALLQAGLFLPLAALLLSLIGIEGAAMAWALRAFADCIGRFILAGRVFPPAAATERALRPLLLFCGLGLVIMACLSPGPALGLGGGFVLVAFLLAWRVAPAEDRAVLLSRWSAPRA